MKKETLKQTKLWKLKKKNVIFVEGVKVKDSLNEWHEGHILRKKDNVSVDFVYQCQTQHGLNWIAKTIFS